MRAAVSILAALSLLPFAAHAQEKAPKGPPGPPGNQATKAAPDRPQRVMIVLDASGSMWAGVGGKPRIVVARAALAEILRDWNPKTQLGLMAYGHRRKGDCNDIQTLVPVGKVNPARIIGIVNGINPKGRTPLSEAVRRAAETLKYTEERATVILLSDGRETCNADPCAVGKALKAAGVDFRAHVIGFALKKSEQKGLRCLAANTGGRYFSAQNAEELRKALRETAKSAQEKAETEKEPEKNYKATVQAPDTIQITEKFKVTWTGPDRPADFVTIVPTGAKPGTYLSYAYTSKGSPATLTAPDKPGAYEVRYVLARSRRVLASVPITVRPVESKLAAPATVGIGKLLEVSWTGPNGERDYITVVKPDAKNSAYGSYAYTAGGNPVKLRAPETAGRYEIRYVTGRTRRILARATIDVKPIGTTLKAPEKVAMGRPFKVAFTGPANPRDYITVVKPTAKDGTYGSYRYARTGSPVTLQAPTMPGTYEIRYVLGRTKKVVARLKVEVEKVDTSLSAPETVTVGNSVPVQWVGPGGPRDLISIVTPNTPDVRYGNYAYARKQPAVVRAPDTAGQYEIRYIAAGPPRRVLARRPLTVAEAKVTLSAPAAVKTGERFTVEWTGPKNDRDYITIVKPDARKGRYGSYGYTKNGKPVRLTAPKNPGRYELRFVLGKSKRVLARLEITVE